MRRIAIVGSPGTGKTTLARNLAADLGLTHIEMDALFHGPGWTAATPPEFRAKLQAAMDHADATTDGWTMCGNYRDASDLIAERAADTIVWLDLPRSVVMRRVVTRTVRRFITRQELWNGNREPLTNFYRWDPEKNIIRWAWTHYPEYRRQGLASLADGSWSHAAIHHLRSSADVTRFHRAALDAN